MNSVVGVDLSLASTGVCVCDPLQHILPTVYRIQSKGGKDDSLHLRVGRLVDIVDRILQVVPGDADVFIEGPSFGQMRQGGEHQRAGLWWSLVQLLDLQGHQVVSVAPSVLKKYATGKGNAGKDEVLAAAIRRYPTINITGNDVADATVLCAIGMRLNHEPLEDTLPKAHLDALTKLEVAA